MKVPFDVYSFDRQKLTELIVLVGSSLIWTGRRLARWELFRIRKELEKNPWHPPKELAQDLCQLGPHGRWAPKFLSLSLHLFVSAFVFVAMAVKHSLPKSGFLTHFWAQPEWFQPLFYQLDIFPLADVSLVLDLLDKPKLCHLLHW